MLEAITVLTLAYVRCFTLYKHITVVMGAVTLDFLSVLCNLGIALVACVCQYMYFQGKTLLHEHSEFFPFRKVTCILAYLGILLKLTLLKIQSGITIRV